MRIGSLGFPSRLAAAATTLLLSLMLALPSGWALGGGGRAKNKKPGSASAILGGTVFRGAGFALPGAEAIATLLPPAEGDGSSGAPGGRKEKKPALWKTSSDARGEFILRLPAGPGRYNVVVRATGYKPQEKQVTFAGDERQDQNFLLEPDGSVK